MGLLKCPRCELNYILDGGDLCTVCRKEVRGEDEQDEIAELCSECGENPALPGSELCATCLKDVARRVVESTDDDVVVPEDPEIEIDSVATMDEIEIDLDDPLEHAAFDEDDEFKDDDDDDDDEEVLIADDEDDDDLLDR